MVQIVNDGFLLEGTAYFNRLNSAGQYIGIATLPGISKLEIKPSADIKELGTKDKGYYGQITASVAVAKPTEITVGFRNGSSQGVALAMMGSATTLTSGGGTVTAATLVAKLGYWVETANRNLTAASVVVKHSSNTPVYVENTDYEVNYDLGMIRAIPGGAITDNQSLKVDYAYGAISGYQVSGGTQTQAKGRLILDGRNLVNNKMVKFEAYQVLLVSDGGMDLMGDDVTEFTMSGRMETPSGKTEPFIIQQW